MFPRTTAQSRVTHLTLILPSTFKRGKSQSRRRFPLALLVRFLSIRDARSLRQPPVQREHLAPSGLPDDSQRSIDSRWLATPAQTQGQSQQQTLDVPAGNLLYWLYKALLPGQTHGTSSLETRLVFFKLNLFILQDTDAYSPHVLLPDTQVVLLKEIWCCSSFLATQALQEDTDLYCPLTNLQAQILGNTACKCQQFKAGRMLKSQTASDSLVIRFNRNPESRGYVEMKELSSHNAEKQDSRKDSE